MLPTHRYSRHSGEWSAFLNAKSCGGTDEAPAPEPQGPEIFGKSSMNPKPFQTEETQDGKQHYF